MTLDLHRYLERIHYPGQPGTDLASLARLQRLHLQHIPFENLNPLLGLPVPLDRPHLASKLLQQQRGGYCFEHGLLFLEVLQQLGFQARPLTGRVFWNQPQGARPPRSHLVLLVTVDGDDYLCDVGFGGVTPVAPLRLLDPEPQHTALGSYRLCREEHDFLLHTRLDDDWALLYRFDLSEPWPVDLEMANWYVACHPDSKFVNNLICVRTEADHRHTLLNDSYTLRHQDGRSEKRRIDTPDGMLTLLRDTFQIRLDGLEAGIETMLSEKGWLTLQ